MGCDAIWVTHVQRSQTSPSALAAANRRSSNFWPFIMFVFCECRAVCRLCSPRRSSAIILPWGCSLPSHARSADCCLPACYFGNPKTFHMPLLKLSEAMFSPWGGLIVLLSQNYSVHLHARHGKSWYVSIGQVNYRPRRDGWENTLTKIKPHA